MQLLYFAMLVFWVRQLNLPWALTHTIPDNVQKAAGQFSKECCNENNEAGLALTFLTH